MNRYGGGAVGCTIFLAGVENIFDGAQHEGLPIYLLSLVDQCDTSGSGTSLSILREDML